MENKILETIWIEIETEENKKYCKKLKKIFVWLPIILILIMFSWWYISTIPFYNSYDSAESIIIILLNLIGVIWIFWIPTYAIYLKKKLLITKKCFKKTLIIWATPLIILLLGAWWCLILLLQLNLNGVWG